jgi:hypothetical protein
VKLIPILMAMISLLDAQTASVYVVTRAASAESKALFSAKLVRMNATRLHWYEDTGVVRIDIPAKLLVELQADPDVELVLSDREIYGPIAPLPTVAQVSQTSPPVPLPVLPPIPAPVLPNMPMAAPGMGMMPGMGTPVGSAFGLADALAGGVAQKLLNRPPSCKVSIGKNRVTYTAQGGEGLIEVNASGSCAWQAQASVGWITILSGSGVSGSGIISYRVAAGEGLARSASIWILATAGGSPIKGKASQVVTQNK